MTTRMTSQRCAALLIATVSMLGLAACGGDDSTDSTTSAASGDPITVGFVVGKTGVLESYDVPAQTMAQLAIDDINAEGGIDGRPIETVEADMKSKPELAGNAATQVISDGADMLLLPCDFDLGSPAALVAQEAGQDRRSRSAQRRPRSGRRESAISPTRWDSPASAEGAAAAEWAYKDQKWTSTYVLLDDTLDQNKQGTDAFKERFEGLGGEIVGEDTFKQEDQSIDAQVSRDLAAVPAARFPLRLELPARVRGGDQADSRCRDRHPDRRRLGPRR